MNKKSILGNKSRLYRIKKDVRGAILDDPEKGLLEFWPRGYTYQSEIDNQSRQFIYKSMWKHAVEISSYSKLYPFGKKNNYDICFQHDECNMYDENAVKIFFLAPSGTPLFHLNGRDMGFIPKKISKQVLRNLDMINAGNILKVKSHFHKKYYTAKIVIAYGETVFSSLNNTALTRFSSILEQ